eukprot:826028-Pyramimonas_sp.AAC.1
MTPQDASKRPATRSPGRLDPGMLCDVTHWYAMLCYAMPRDAQHKAHQHHVSFAAVDSATTTIVYDINFPHAPRHILTSVALQHCCCNELASLAPSLN